MVDGPRNLPSKKDVVLALLQGPSVFVHLDPRKKGVVVPANFRKQPQLVLQIGLNMAVSIPDLRVDDEGVSCTLSFSRSPFWCALPWSAIYALVSEDGPGMVWPDDVPPEVAAQMAAAVQKQTPKRPRPKLAVAPRPEDAPADAAAEGDAPPKSEGESEPEAPAAATAPSSPPALSAVPSPRDANVVPLRPPKKEEPAWGKQIPDSVAGAESDSEPEDTPRPPAPRITGGKKKRELPPYLRVIK